ncbi:hypothetical protein EVAR_4460_1 [Eumeta japonica]|uniref:Uncharacterized protein n=1 Tax=Eumeta variegata TaxID=151549 RepID=A0A4C1SXV9_EUMVA|nr:hypothetical protein EVAR_4460_1 [Eumeta japonica]
MKATCVHYREATEHGRHEIIRGHGLSRFRRSGLMEREELMERLWDDAGIGSPKLSLIGQNATKGKCSFTPVFS